MRKDDLRGLRRLALVSALAASLLGGTGVLAADPHAGGTTGQPSQNCQAINGGSSSLNVPGFNTAGFNHATQVYAGTKGTLPNGNTQNPTAVSQYDVACFERSMH